MSSWDASKDLALELGLNALRHEMEKRATTGLRVSACAQVGGQALAISLRGPSYMETQAEDWGT